MIVIRFALSLVLFCGLLFTARAADGPAKAKKPKSPNFTISKETTHITEPLSTDGTIDYATAINQRLSRGVTPENNANVLFWRAHGPHPERATMPREFFRWMGIDSPPEKGDYFLNLYEYLRDRAKINPKDRRFNPIVNQQSEASSRPWKAADYPHIAAWLKANEGPLKLVVQGTKRPRYFSPLVVTADEDGQPGGLIMVLLPAVQANRSFARALSARAMLHLGEGRTEAAWQDLLACHRLGRLVGHGATLVESLVGIAIESIATHADLALIDRSKPGAKQVARYLKELSSLPPRLEMVDIINQGERFMFLDSTMLIARTGNKGVKALDVGDPIALKIGAVVVDWDTVLRLGNAWYDRLEAALRKESRAEMLKAVDKLNAKLSELAKRNPLRDLVDARGSVGKAVGQKIGNVLVAMLLPAVSAAQSAQHRAEQEHANLRVALALAAYRSDRGRYPEKLSELSPKYLPKIPGDIFSGRPLVYVADQDAYLLYSYGLNGKNNGGRGYSDRPRGDDLGVRMPLR